MEDYNMKKNYLKPEIQEVTLQYQAHLLYGSQQRGQFVDDPIEDDDWDFDGGQ